MRRIDASIKELTRQEGQFLSLYMWATSEILLTGSGHIAARVNANQAEIEDYITFIEPFATFISPRYCDFTITGINDHIGFFNNEMLPRSSKKSFDFSIPLPLSQSFSVSLPYATIDTSVSSDHSTCSWSIYELAGINDLYLSGDRGVGFENKFEHNPFAPSFADGTYQSMTVEGNAIVGIHYVYEDGSATMANETWYTSMTGIGSVRCYNPA